jgi:glycosyltransferase involved in cell wall biosynthesis
MYVVHIITRLIVGGAQENTVASVLGLGRRAGTRVALLAGRTRGPEGTLEALVAGVPGLLVRVPGLVRPLHPWNDVRALVFLTRWLRQERPGVVHTHSGKAGVLGRWAARRAGVPVIIHTIHGPSFGQFQGAWANAFYRAAERAAGRVTTHFVGVAEAMIRQYLEAGIGQADQYTRIFSGFDLEPFLSARDDPAFRRELGLAPDDFVVGKVARLFALKGHDDLLAVAPELCARYPKLKLLLVGDGEWRGRFERRVRHAGLARRVVFSGLVLPQAVARYLGVMDVLVHLSRREGLARVLPQALAAGKPVIAFACDGAPEVCVDHETGYLLPVGDRTGLCQRLGQLACDPELRVRLGRRGRQRVAACFGVEQMIEALHTLYTRLLAQTDRRSQSAPC